MATILTEWAIAVNITQHYLCLDLLVQISVDNAVMPVGSKYLVSLVTDMSTQEALIKPRQRYIVRLRLGWWRSAISMLHQCDTVGNTVCE